MEMIPNQNRIIFNYLLLCFPNLDTYIVIYLIKFIQIKIKTLFTLTFLLLYSIEVYLLISVLCIIQLLSHYSLRDF